MPVQPPFSASADTHTHTPKNRAHCLGNRFSACVLIPFLRHSFFQHSQYAYECVQCVRANSRMVPEVRPSDSGVIGCKIVTGDYIKRSHTYIFYYVHVHIQFFSSLLLLVSLSLSLFLPLSFGRFWLSLLLRIFWPSLLLPFMVVASFCSRLETQSFNGTKYIITVS